MLRERTCRCRQQNKVDVRSISGPKGKDVTGARRRAIAPVVGRRFPTKADRLRCLVMSDFRWTKWHWDGVSHNTWVSPLASDATQDFPGGKVNILGGHSIGHAKQKHVYVHV
jgi:hypothetical protein